MDADDATASFTVSSSGKDGYTLLPKNGWKQGLNAIEITATGTNQASETKKVWIVCFWAPLAGH